MLFQDVLTQRIIIILIVQIWPVFYCSYFSYKLLKRAKNRSTYTLSSFFITFAIAYFFASFSIFVLNTPLAYLFYIIGINFFFFSHCFYIIISWVFVKLDDKSPRWKFYTIVVFYFLLSTYVFWVGYYFKGITYDSSTLWIPTYSWFFLSISWIFLITFIVFPQIYYSFKLYKVFEGEVLRHRINLFLLSVLLELTVVFLLFLYNTLVENQIYRTIFIIIAPVFSTVSALLIYRSFGRELE